MPGPKIRAAVCGITILRAPVVPEWAKVKELVLFWPATRDVPMLHVSAADTAPDAQYWAASSSSGDALVVLTVATVVLAQSHATAEVWLNVVALAPFASVNAPAAFCRLLHSGRFAALGMSAATSARKVGAAAAPDVGPANT